MEITKYQKFEAVTIQRSEIKNAPYNPRIIRDEARKKLKQNIQKIGLIETLVVNKNTMNLVSGHQRLAILDSLERKKDYMITVAMVSLTEKEEKEQNVFLNNERAMGEYDIDLLKDLMYDVDVENLGFDIEDLGILGVELDLDSANQMMTEIESEVMDFSKVISENNKEIKEEKKELKQQDNQVHHPATTLEDKYENNRAKRVDLINQSQDGNKNSMDIFVTLTFSNNENKVAFMERINKEPDETHLKGEIFMQEYLQ